MNKNKKFLLMWIIQLLDILIFSSCNIANYSSNHLQSQRIAVEELANYMSVYAICDGILYGTVQTENNTQFATYDAKGFVYLHGNNSIKNLDYIGDTVCCISGEDMQTFYITYAYYNPKGYDAYLYSFSPNSLRQRVHIGIVGDAFLAPKAIDKDVAYLDCTLQGDNGISSLVRLDTKTGKKKTLLQLSFDNKTQTGESILNYAYCANDGYIYIYLCERTITGTFFYLRCYDLQGNLQNTWELSEFVEEFSKSPIYHMTVEDNVLFLNNFSTYSVFIDISDEKPKMLMSNLEEINYQNERHYMNSYGSNLSEPVSIYWDNRKDIVMLFNRENKEYVEYPISDFGIEGSINRICVDHTGNILISSAKESKEKLFYFGSISKNTLTNVHPLQLSDLYSPE